jgi:8-oxo-dGTP diphosphatase
MEGMRKGIDCIGVCVVFACHDGAGRYLLSKRTANCRDEIGTWDPGGGSIELHDTVEDTLRKEILEEYCTEVLEHEFLGYRSVHRDSPQGPTHWVALDFKVRIDPAQARNGEPHKLETVEWFTLDALPTPLHSEFPRFLQMHKDKI